MTGFFNYIPRRSPVHGLTGASKLAGLFLLSLASMITYDTRLLAALTLIAAVSFGLSRIRVREVKVLLLFTFGFMLLNNLFIYLFQPEQGVMLYGTRHLIGQIAGRYTITQEQLFYHLNVVLKYLSTLPLIILFVSTTDPSEFAASLNRIGISYKISYAVALTLRYIPDIQREYRDISISLQARGVEMTRKEPFFQRVRNVATTLFPLILTSMQRITVISNAMELRSFGKNRKRTWYRAKPFRAGDYAVFVLGGAAMAAAVLLIIRNGGRFYNPFV